MFVDDGFSVLDTCGIMAQRSSNTQEVKVEKIAIEKIVPNPYQPRKTFDDEGLADLSASIAQYGVLQPLLVAPAENGDYMLIAGERRLRASKMAELKEVPCATTVSATASLISPVKKIILSSKSLE